MSNNDLISGFNDIDSKRVKIHLVKLLHYINVDKMAIVGGLAIRYLLAKAGIKYPVRDFNDLDIMVKEANDVSAKVSKDFLVYHYHPQIGDSFYIVLIDPESRTKVDIFDWNPPLEDYITVKFEGYKLKMRSVEDQLVKTVYDIQRISTGKKVDPKQFMDATLLRKIANLKKADNLWKKRNYPNYPKSITDAINRANKIAQVHPTWVQKNPFKRLKPYVCTTCQETSDFKITPMVQIYKVLGYVE